MNQEVLSQMLTDFESAMSLPKFSHEMQPWDIVIAMRDSLPPHEQKIAELFIKLGEAQEILNELHQY
ncbi:MAG: hypothetical protein FWE27_09770 [Defluviitaleaceae bacterium]|nr:hypothetical protein [Defluviitaleaceae bacterium]